MSRSDFESSEKTRRAAQQDAARAALEVLQDRPPPGASGPAVSVERPPETPKPEVQEVVILWLPQDPSEMVSFRKVQVVSDDFLAATEELLGEAVAHPLSWLGNRPKGLSLYEAVEPPVCSVNARATALAGLEVYGESFLMDASAHSRGAVLADMTLARYEYLKANMSGHLSGPVADLNQMRSMLLCGHPKLPEKYSAETWVGQNPKALLIDVARRRGFAPPQLEVSFYHHEDLPQGRNWFRASATITKEDDQKWDYGDPSTNKMDTQQDASLKVLHQLQSEDQEQGKRWQHPLVPTVVKAISDHVERTAARKPRRSFVRGSKVVCSYSIKLMKATATANVAVEMLLEKQERLTAAVTGRILHPMLQDLLETLPMGEEVVLRTPCHYEQIACDLELRAQLLELQLPPEPEPPKKVIKFSPPLWKQRQAFIVQALLARCVKSVLDLGCGDGKLLEALLPLGFERLVGLELSEHRTKDARQRLAAAAHGAANGAAAWTVLSGDFVAPEDEGEQAPWILEAAGIEGIVLCEVLEHLPEPSMPRLPQALFCLQPQVVIVTSPNADFGDSSDEEDEVPVGGAHLRAFRHSDHEREWTREEFRAWSETVAEQHGYWISELGGVGFLPEMEAHGPCTQLCIFERKEVEETPATEPPVDTAAADTAADAEVDVELLVSQALRSEELGGAGSGLWKYVHREGTGSRPPALARVNLHYASYLSNGSCVETSRCKNHETPCAFQLGGQQALPSWQLAAASMRPGEVCWICSPPSYAYGPQGVPRKVPGNETMWFCLELNFARAPGTVKFSNDLQEAMLEAEKHMEVGRDALRRCAFAQGRQAFRRARAAMPEKLLLKRGQEDVDRFATLDRAALLNQALCCLKLGDAVAPKEAVQHFRDARAACDELFVRHGESGGTVENEENEETEVKIAEKMPQLQVMLRRASQEGAWKAKAFFRRGLAKEKLQYLADAIEDFEAAQRLEPADTTVAKQLKQLRSRQRKAELDPAKMFKGILQREREEREKEEAAADLAARKQRREERLKAQAAQAAEAAEDGAPST